MKSAVYMNGKKFKETQFALEEDFEKTVKDNSENLFGEKTIYIDLKNKIDTKSLGGSIPDGILFDITDKEDIQFYLIEVELAKHDFYNHIFPQITKFFAFYKNSSSRNNLIERLFSFIKNDEGLGRKFSKLLGEKELYKSIKDSVENNQNILLIIDENKPEIREAQETYTATWDKLVKVEVLKEYKVNGNEIFILNPDFSEAEITEVSPKEKKDERYTEAYHLEEVDKEISEAYSKIKTEMLEIDSEIVFNPQKYYISIRKNKNFAFQKVKRKKIRVVVMLPLEKGKEKIKNHKIKELSDSVQDYYNGPCFEVVITENKNLEEVLDLLKEAYMKQEEQ